MKTTNWENLVTEYVVKYKESAPKMIAKEINKTFKEIREIVDGNKEIYKQDTGGFEKGEEKSHLDSCCNETIDNILAELIIRGF